MMGTPLLFSVTAHDSVRKLEQSLTFLETVPFPLLTVFCKNSNHCWDLSGFFLFFLFFFFLLSYKVCPFFLIVVSRGLPYCRLAELQVLTTTHGVDSKLFRVLVCVSRCCFAQFLPCVTYCDDPQPICVTRWPVSFSFACSALSLFSSGWTVRPFAFCADRD